MIESGGAGREREIRQPSDAESPFKSDERQSFSSQFYVPTKEGKDRPPLGKVPDFAKLDAERAELLHSLPELTKEKAPYLVDHLSTISNAVNATRETFSLEPVTYRTDQYKLIDPSIDLTLLGHGENRKPGFYDPNTGLIILRDEPIETFNDLRTTEVSQTVLFTHDLFIKDQAAVLVHTRSI